MSIPNATPLKIGCNLSTDIRFDLRYRDRPTVIMSSGYGPSSFDRPLSLQLIRNFSAFQLNWLQYRYIERSEANYIDDLLISSAFFTLSTLAAWVREQGFTTVGLYGNSFGANIALEFAIANGAEFVVLSNPVFDMADYRLRQLGEISIANWKEKGTVEIEYDGGTVTSSYRFMEEALRQQLLTRTSCILAPTLILQGSDDPILTIAGAEQFAKQTDQRFVKVLRRGGHTVRSTEALSDAQLHLEEFLTHVLNDGVRP